MAKTTKVGLGGLATALVAEVKAKTALEYKATAFEVFSQVIQKTPVLTGRARANWNISTDSPNFNTTTSNNPDMDMNIQTLNFPTVYVANGLDYVVELEDGKSWKQAPNGIINPALAAAMANRRSK